MGGFELVTPQNIEKKYLLLPLIHGKRDGRGGMINWLEIQRNSSKRRVIAM